MSVVKCFDITEMVVDEATRQFAPLFKENAESKEILQQYCQAIDMLADEFGGMSCEASVDGIKMTIHIVLECNEFTVENNHHRLYDLADRAVRMKFFSACEDSVSIEFVFPSIWDKV